MKEKLNSIRKQEKNISIKKMIINSSLILLLGVVLGILSKYLDNLAIDDSIWYQNIIGKLDLRNFFSEMAVWLLIAISISVFSSSPKRSSINVFLFFIGMNISYHLYTIIFSGFNPRSYMMIWYTLTILSPLLGYICWYAKSNNYISIIINSIIYMIMSEACFSTGLIYINPRSILYTITFISVIFILYKDKKVTITSVLIGLLLSMFIRIPLITS